MKPIPILAAALVVALCWGCWSCGRAGALSEALSHPATVPVKIELKMNQPKEPKMKAFLPDAGEKR